MFDYYTNDSVYNYERQIGLKMHYFHVFVQRNTVHFNYSILENLTDFQNRVTAHF